MKKISLDGLNKDYWITEDGEIFSSYSKKFLKPKENHKGYLRVELYIGSTPHKFFIHRLVLTTYNPVENMENLQVNHIDGNKLNNNVSNLEWCTNQENQDHAWKTGLYDNRHYSGENNPANKLKQEQVKGIIDKLLNHATFKSLSAEYNISESTIYAIKHKKIWKSLTKDINFN